MAVALNEPIGRAFAKACAGPRATHLRQYGGKAGRAALVAGADKRAAGVAKTIEAIRGEGVTSANGIAKALNERSIATPRGGLWTARSVLNLTARLS